MQYALVWMSINSSVRQFTVRTVLIQFGFIAAGLES